MAHVFVTGGSGFIGQNLVRALIARGDDVACLVRDVGRGDGIRKIGARLIVGTVNDPAKYREELRDREIVYHLAGVTKARRTDELNFVNEAGTRNLAEACAAQTSPPTFVAISSLAAAGVSPLGALAMNRKPTIRSPITAAANWPVSKRS
ncbi:MAG: NAD-dependent epimerase/dehydratase family protein [Pirellulales bacterium]